MDSEKEESAASETTTSESDKTEDDVSTNICWACIFFLAPKT